MSGEQSSGLPGIARRAFQRDRVTGQVAIGLVGVLCVAAVVYGVGVASARYNLSDIGAWLNASKKGMVVHANGLAGKIDGKADLIATMRGHKIKIVQDGRNVLLVDEVTGVVSRLDPSQLKVEQSRAFAVGVQVVIGGGAAYTIDSVKGVVQQIDPVNLTAIGQAAALPPPLDQAGIDGKGQLWVPAPQTGQAVPFQAGRQLTPVSVGKPGERLSLSIAAGVPVVTNSTAATASIIKPEGIQKVVLPSTVTKTGRAGAKVPPVVDGQIVPMLGAGGSLVLLNTGTGSLTSVALKMARHDFGVPQMLGPRVYIPDQTVGALVVYHSATNQFEPQLRVTGKPGPLEVFVKDGMLWANDPNGEDAISLDLNGAVKRIKKYEPAVPGGPRRPLPTQGPAGGGSGNNNGGGGGNGGNRPGGGAQRPPGTGDRPVPGVPQDVVAKGDKGKITVTFKPSRPDRSPKAVKPVDYILLDEVRTPLPDARPAEVKHGASSYRFEVDRQCDGADYGFRVMVRYRHPTTKELTGTFSSVTRTQACKVPGAPEATTASGQNGKITIRFQPGTDATAVAKYVLLNGDNSPVQDASPAEVSKDGPSYQFEVSRPCTSNEQRFKVAGVFKKSGQDQMASSPEVSALSCSAPNTPSGLRGTPSNKTAALTWQGSGYDVTYTVSGPNGSDTTKSESFRATGLRNNQTHSFTVTAANGAGTASPASTSVSLAYPRQGYRNANNDQTNSRIKSSPNGGQVVGTIPQREYRTITVICQTKGQRITEDQSGETSDVWDHIEFNGGTAYISDTLMATPRGGYPAGGLFECD